MPAPTALAAATIDTRAAYDRVFELYVPVAVAVFILVAVALAVPVVRDRSRPGREPSPRATSARLEGGYAVLLAVVAAVLLWRTLSAIGDTNPVVARAAAAPGAGPAGLTVRVIAAKWNWRFEYPGGVVEQGDGPRRIPALVVPAGQPVRFRLSATDVTHAFWIPGARFKFDAVPGRTNVFDMAFRPGIAYEDNRCSEFCGQYHDQMRFRVDVRAPAAFRAWLAARQARVRA